MERELKLGTREKIIWSKKSKVAVRGIGSPNACSSLDKAAFFYCPAGEAQSFKSGANSF
ncbi:hypothetical protein ES703_22005 [subsurface metagenome]